MSGKIKAELLETLPITELGEGPYWDHKNGFLYWVDITGHALHRFNFLSKKHEQCETPSMVGFAVMCSDGKLIAGLQDGLYKIDFWQRQIKKFCAPQNMPAENRFNDAKCDRRGRLWCGTMNCNPDHAHPTGSLFRLDQKKLIEIESDIFISNGLGWSPDNTVMYYTDTVRKVIWQYDYDIESGAISNRSVFLQKKDGLGRPDGLCVDSQGRVLTALWPGWGIEIYTPDGKLDGRIELPVPQVSSCAFGGPDFKTLFITTAKEGMSDAAILKHPLSGRVFAVEMEIPGLPETPCVWIDNE